jgi:pyruvate/2-oxoglutarate dehydrogenase complex dihydrolipoamide acyltransferase (E2) component
MKIKLKLVRVGMNMTEATIAQWFKQPGARFVTGEPLYAIETEKVTQDVEATAPGTLVEILAPAGTEVTVGAPVCTVDLEGSS